MNQKRLSRQELVAKNSSKFIRKDSKGLNQYYVPELDEWVYRFSKYIVMRSGLTQRHWYNKYILEVDDPDYSPLCSKGDCNNKVNNFKGAEYGYPLYCCLLHARLDEDMSEEKSKSIKLAMADPQNKLNHKLATKLGHNTPEYKKYQSDKSKRQWEDPEYREKNLSKIPRSHLSQSKISIKFFDELKSLLRSLALGRLFIREKYVKTGPECSDDHPYRYIDLYIEDLGIGIEFQGDYWHPRDISRYGCQAVLTSVMKDQSRKSAIMKSDLNPHEIYYITESDYINHGLIDSMIDIIEQIEIYNQVI